MGSLLHVLHLHGFRPEVNDRFCTTSQPGHTCTRAEQFVAAERQVPRNGEVPAVSSSAATVVVPQITLRCSCNDRIGSSHDVSRAIPHVTNMR